MIALDKMGNHVYNSQKILGIPRIGEIRSDWTVSAAL
jgi:hypothetical protein